MADHDQKGGLPLPGAGIAPVELASLFVPPPPPAHMPAGAKRTLATTVPYSKPSRRSEQGHKDNSALDLRRETAGTHYGYYRPALAAVQSTPTSQPPRVPSYYAYASRNSIVPLPGSTGPSGKGWEYITPPVGSPPPSDINGHQ